MPDEHPYRKAPGDPDDGPVAGRNGVGDGDGAAAIRRAGRLAGSAAGRIGHAARGGGVVGFSAAGSRSCRTARLGSCALGIAPCSTAVATLGRAERWRRLLRRAGAAELRGDAYQLTHGRLHGQQHPAGAGRRGDAGLPARAACAHVPRECARHDRRRAGARRGRARGAVLGGAGDQRQHARSAAGAARAAGGRGLGLLAAVALAGGRRSPLRRWIAGRASCASSRR